MSTSSVCPRLKEIIRDLNAEIASERKKHPREITPELQDLLGQLADAQHSFQRLCGPPQPLSFSPKSINFGIVPPGTSGPNLYLDPAIPPPAISFAGGIEIASTPANATVSASILGDTAHFQVRDIIVLDFNVVDGNVGRKVAAKSDGGAPVGVTERQFVLVRVKYEAIGSEGTFRATCVIKSSAWETIQVPLSLTLGNVVTDFPSEPVVLTQGKDTEVPIVLRSFAGFEVRISYEIDRRLFHEGVAIVSAPIVIKPHEVKNETLVFRTDAAAPLGTHTVGIDQLGLEFKDQLIQVNVVSPPLIDRRALATQKIDEMYGELGGPTGRLGARTSELIAGAPGQFIKTYRGGNLVFTADEKVNLTDGVELRMVYQGIHCFGNPGGIKNSDAYAIITLFGAEQKLQRILKVPEDGTDDLYKNFSAGDSSTQGQISILGTAAVLPIPPQTLTLSTQVYRAGILGGDSESTKRAVANVLGRAASELVGLIGLGLLSDEAEKIGQALGNGLSNLFGVTDSIINTAFRTFKSIEELTALPPSDSLEEGGIKHNFATDLITDGDASYKMYFDIEVLPVGPPVHT